MQTDSQVDRYNTVYNIILQQKRMARPGSVSLPPSTSTGIATALTGKQLNAEPLRVDICKLNWQINTQRRPRGNGDKEIDRDRERGWERSRVDRLDNGMSLQFSLVYITCSLLCYGKPLKYLTNADCKSFYNKIKWKTCCCSVRRCYPCRCCIWSATTTNANSAKGQFYWP